MTVSTTPQKRLLTAGMYEGRQSGIFNLSHRQTRHAPVITVQAGWYNDEGDRLGRGDLDPADIIRISEQVFHGEAFVILTEASARQIPGKKETPYDFMTARASYFIARGECFWVNPTAKGITPFGTTPEYITIEGVRFQKVSRDDAKVMLKKAKHAFAERRNAEVRPFAPPLAAG